MIQWETPVISRQTTDKNRSYYNWVDVSVGDEAFSVDFYKSGVCVCRNSHWDRKSKFIADQSVLDGFRTIMKISEFYTKIDDHPELRSLVLSFIESLDPVCFAAIFDYIAENIPEFLE